MTSGECAHQSHIRPFTSPTVVRLTSWPIQAESDMRNDFSVRFDHRPHAIKMPSVSDEAALHPVGSDRVDNLFESRMQRCFAAGEHYVRHAHRLTRFANHALEQVY